VFFRCDLAPRSLKVLGLLFDLSGTQRADRLSFMLDAPPPPALFYIFIFSQMMPCFSTITGFHGLGKLAGTARLFPGRVDTIFA